MYLDGITQQSTASSTFEGFFIINLTFGTRWKSAYIFYRIPIKDATFSLYILQTYVFLYKFEVTLFSFDIL